MTNHLKFYMSSNIKLIHKQKSVDLPITRLNSNVFYYSSSYSNLLKEESTSSTNADPIIVNDENPDDTESNIGLTLKQPSYLSLSDMIITKGGDVIRDSCSLLNISEENIAINDSASEKNNNYKEDSIF